MSLLSTGEVYFYKIDVFSPLPCSVSQRIIQWFHNESFSGLMPAAPDMKITDGIERYPSEDVTAQVRYKKIHPSTKKVEMSSFPILYPYG